MEATDNSAEGSSRRWIIVDSSAVLHRCFHGYVNPQPGVLDRRTLDVAALAGYVAYIDKVRREFECEHIVHVLDAPTASHYRARLYPDYKANRSDTSPFLAAQKLMLPRLLRALGESVICHPGYEADDVIGTLVDQISATDDVALILTKDKDLFQLIEPNKIMVVHYVKDQAGYNNHIFYHTPEDVVAKMGVRPDQVVDFLALVGDEADNIPGVDGVGEGTAAQWLGQHGCLDTLITHADTIKGKRGDALRAAKNDLTLYRQLTMVCRQVPGITLDAAAQPPIADAVERKTMLDCLSWPVNWNWGDPIPTAPGLGSPSRGAGPGMR